MSISLKEVFSEINQVRTNPKAYSEKLKKYITYFKDNKLIMPDSKIRVRTAEGPKAYEEAIEFLNSQEPLESVTGSKGLTKIASEFLEMVKKTDPEKLGDINIEKIIDKYGEFSGNFSRAVEFGGTTSEQVIVNLLVCDGDPSRGQRYAILNPNLFMYGLASGIHPEYKTGTIIIGCTRFKNKIDSNDTETFEEFVAFKTDTQKQKKAQPKQEAAKEETKQEVVKEEVKQEEVKEDKKVEPKPAPVENKINIEDDTLPEDAVSVDKKEKIIIEGGKKKKLITKIYKLKDGTERKVEGTVKI